MLLSPEARAIIEQQPRSGSPWVFPSPVNPARARVDLSLWKRVRKLAGIEDVRLHDLRHTFASQAAMQGIPLPVVARLLGHAQVQMTLRYAHVSDRDVEAAAERIGGAMAGIMNNSPSAGDHAMKVAVCGAHAPDGSARCERCAGSAAKPSRKKAKNARGRRRYVRRRVRGLCIDCAAPAQGAARCPECARRSYLRSDEHRGLPILSPRYTVIEIATGADHGTWDSMAEVAMSLAYARLSREDVEVISDVSPMAALIGY